MIEIRRSNGKNKGGGWECFDAENFFGWESDHVVVVTIGVFFVLEMATRAKIQLIVILVEDDRDKEYYAKYQKYFQAAADKGLLELLASY